MLHVYGIFVRTVKVDQNSVGYEETLQEYKKFLGPDWTPSTKKAGVVVCNHSSFIDVVAIYASQTPIPAFLCKSEIKHIPGVSYMTNLTQALYIERVGSKAEDRAHLLT